MKIVPKSFWSHVKGETNSKSNIGDLKDKDGEIWTDDQEKAVILNDLFASVFTVEGNSEIPDFSQKLPEEDSISQTEIKPEEVL